MTSGSAVSSASMSASELDQPTETRSERCASTPMASSTGDGSRASDEHALPEWAAMPARSRPKQHGLRFDAEHAEAHEVGDPSERVAVDDDTVEGRHRREHPIGQRSCRSGLALDVDRRARLAEPDDAGDVLEAGPSSALLVAAAQQRTQAKPAAHEQRADARWSAQLVRADRQQVGVERGEVDRHLPSGGGRVDLGEHAALAAGGDDLGHRLHRADLVVRPLHVHERGVGTDGREHIVDIDAGRRRRPRRSSPHPRLPRSRAPQSVRRPGQFGVRRAQRRPTPRWRSPRSRRS